MKRKVLNIMTLIVIVGLALAGVAGALAEPEGPTVTVYLSTSKGNSPDEVVETIVKTVPVEEPRPGEPAAPAAPGSTCAYGGDPTWAR